MWDLARTCLLDSQFPENLPFQAKFFYEEFSIFDF